MIINDAGRKVVMDAEQCRLEAYLCPAGRWTIGWGHTGDVKKGDRVTHHQAEAILEFDLDRFERAVSQLAPSANANQFSAMVSLAFNIGIEAFRRSSLLKWFNAGFPLKAATEFAKWCHAGNKVLPGLVKRRKAEADLFCSAVN